MDVCFVSLGCDKNLIDSQEMLGMMAGTKYRLTDDDSKAKAAVVNTCCFIDDAKKESIGAILPLAERRKEGSLKALIVTGCLAQRYAEEILTEIPEVDAVIGTGASGHLIEALDEALSRKKNKKRIWMEDISAPREPGRRVLTDAAGYAYLRIAEGCDKHCTYCVIPSIRGEYRSVPMDKVLLEAQDLVRRGARELILIAQETTRYGTDLYGEKKLPELLKKLSWIVDLKWIRLLYCYPEEITDELILEMKNNPKVVHYIDMPIQHASDAILKKMGRRTSRKELEQTVRRLRRQIPDICIRTTLISGFPTESEEDHAALYDFVRRMKFDRLGVFAYSREEGTPAARLKPQVRAAVKRSRRDELMRLQQEIAFSAAGKQKGRVLTAIIEGRLAPEEAGMRLLAKGSGLAGTLEEHEYIYVARTYRDAPDVDGLLFIPSDAEYLTGDFVDVRITGVSGYDLIGEEAQTP
ncbi:MAG: 30S ribosomal protein S12 methylthiotransferase RimO [Lachnospiraceae bacterium]|nr:30S ribosomal protein S12 methylthiotransferase RimO [Lachnospiraceae bacterium]